MPHMPRRYPTTVGANPELPTQPEHPPIPVRKVEDVASSQRLGIGKISLRDHKGPTPAEIYKALTGKEPDVDPHTGQLVHKPTEPTRPPSVSKA